MQYSPISSVSSSNSGRSEWPFNPDGPLAFYVDSGKLLRKQCQDVWQDSQEKVGVRYTKLWTLTTQILRTNEALLGENASQILENAALYRTAEKAVASTRPLLSGIDQKDAVTALDELKDVLLQQVIPPANYSNPVASNKNEKNPLPSPPVLHKVIQIADELNGLKTALFEMMTNVQAENNKGFDAKLKAKKAEFTVLNGKISIYNEVVAKCLAELAEQVKNLSRGWAQVLIRREHIEKELESLETLRGIMKELEDFSVELNAFGHDRLTFQDDLKNQKDPMPRLDEFKMRFKPLMERQKELAERAKNLGEIANTRIQELTDFVSLAGKVLQDEVNGIQIYDPKTRKAVDDECFNTRESTLTEARRILGELEKSWKQVDDLNVTLNNKIKRLKYALYQNDGKVPYESTKGFLWDDVHSDDEEDVNKIEKVKEN